MKGRDVNNRICIAVTDIKKLLIGLIVDTIAEVAPRDGGSIVPPPEIKRGSRHRRIQGVGKAGSAIKLMPDCNKLFNDEEMDSLSVAAQK